MVETSPESRLAAQYARLRRTAPLVWSPLQNSWLATTFPATREGLANRKLVHPFCLARPVPADAEMGAFLQTWRDLNRGLAHRALHVRTAEALSPRLAATLYEGVEVEIAAIVTATSRRRSFDAVGDLARPLALACLELCLGIAPGALQARQRLVAQVGRIIEDPRLGLPALSGRRLRAAADLLRQAGTGGAGLAASLMGITGATAAEAEVYLVSLLRVASGLEAAMSAALHDLLIQPRLAERLEAGDVEARDVAREVLRLHSPVQAVLRGLPSSGGSSPVALLMLVGSANRDPDLYPDANRFEPDRPDLGHLSFGHGPHRCPASHFVLAALTALLVAAAPHLRRHRIAAGGVSWRRGRWTLQLTRLLVETQP